MELELSEWRKYKNPYTCNTISYIANSPKSDLPFHGGARTGLVSISMQEKQGLTLNIHFPPAVSDSQMQWLQNTQQ